MTSSSNLDQLTPEQLRALAAQLLSQVDTLGKTVETMGKKIDRDQTVIEQLTHEIAWFKRHSLDPATGLGSGKPTTRRRSGCRKSSRRSTISSVPR